MLLLTTLDAWRDRPDRPFRDESAAYAPEEDAAAVATDTFGDAQVVALVIDLPPHVYPGAINRSTVEEVRYARRAPSGRITGFHPRPPAAEALDLLPRPEGGWFRETWRTSVRVAAHGGERATATGIYFLLGPGEESVWHRVRSDELWLWHRGGPLELRLGGDGDAPRTAPGAGGTILLGGAVEHGERPQALVPAGVWQAARPASGREVLAGRVVSPGFDFADFRI